MDTPTETNEAGGVTVVVSSSSPTAETVQLSVSTDEQRIVAEEMSVGPDESQAIATEIRETGRYELTVAVEDGPEDSYPFSTEDYDVQQGSKVIVQIHEEDVFPTMGG